MLWEMPSIFQTVDFSSSWALNTLHALDTIGYCQRPVFSHGVSQHMHKKHPCHNKLCVLSDAWLFETSKSNSEVSKSNSNILIRSYFFLTQSEPFLKMFYTINSSPLIVNRQVLMLIIILSDLRRCPVPLKFLQLCSIPHASISQQNIDIFTS